MCCTLDPHMRAFQLNVYRRSSAPVVVSIEIARGPFSSHSISPGGTTDMHHYAFSPLLPWLLMLSISLKSIPLKGGGRQGVPWSGQEGYEAQRQASQNDCGSGDLRGEMSFGLDVDIRPSWARGSLAVYRTSVGGFSARPGREPFATLRTFRTSGYLSESRLIRRPFEYDYQL